MNATSPLAAALPDVVHASQHAFRAVLNALSRPGLVCSLGPGLPGVALGGAMARALLSLTDDETPVWWQPGDAALQHWLRFHTSAPVATQPELASFAVVQVSQCALNLSAFAAGTATAPECSTTLLIELPALSGGAPTQWRGPGIKDSCQLELPALPSDFWAQWQANHATFPQGVDIIFTCGDSCLGLPRSTRVQAINRNAAVAHADESDGGFQRKGNLSCM